MQPHPQQFRRGRQRHTGHRKAGGLWGDLSRLNGTEIQSVVLATVIGQSTEPMGSCGLCFVARRMTISECHNQRLVVLQTAIVTDCTERGGVTTVLTLRLFGNLFCFKERGAPADWIASLIETENDETGMPSIAAPCRQSDPMQRTHDGACR